MFHFVSKSHKTTNYVFDNFILEFNAKIYIRSNVKEIATIIVFLFFIFRYSFIHFDVVENIGFRYFLHSSIPVSEIILENKINMHKTKNATYSNLFTK